VHALDGIDLSVSAASFVAIMGPSGSGKSTLLSMMGLLDLPDQGEVWLSGQAVSHLSDDRRTLLRRERIGFVFQNFELIPTLTAAENILLPAELTKQAGKARTRLEGLAGLLGLSGRLGARPHQLSGGQQQRVAIARALIMNPLLVLADEPTGNLDSKSGQAVLEILREGVDLQGWTVVMVTHDPAAALYADRVVFLRDGRVVGEGDPRHETGRRQIEAFSGTLPAGTR
jgi:putative ABC transport system ATP-binding protein